MIYELIRTNYDGSKVCLWQRDLNREGVNTLYTYLDRLGAELKKTKEIKRYMKECEKHGMRGGWGKRK